MFGLGAGELFLIFIIALLFLGPKKLPELAKGLGQAMKEFQKARDEMVNEMNKPAPEAKKADVAVTATHVEAKEEPVVTPGSATPANNESPKHS
jgi:TatA/E family protein of Tat protein translocase